MPNDKDVIDSFNLAFQPKPHSVVLATSPKDVQNAVREAVRQGRGVAVQSTGHGRFDSSDNAILVSTTRMRGIDVDPERRTARVAAGVQWGDVIAATAPHGLVPVHGSSPTVGVAGYALGGGIGLLSRSFGYCADTVLEVDLVTASGEILRVAPDENPELFWGVRGGKSSFGIATAIEVQLFPAAEFYGGGLYFHPDAAAELVPAFVQWSRALPEWFSTSLAFARAHVLGAIGNGLSHLLHLRCVSIGDEQESAHLLETLRSLPGLLHDTVDLKPYSRIREVHNDPVTPLPFTERSRYLPTLSANLVEGLIDAFQDDAVAPVPYVELRRLGGAMARDPLLANCVGGRGSEFTFVVLGSSDDSARARIDHAFGLGDLESAGQPVLNFQGEENGPDRVLAAYDVDDRERLVALKRRYDPDNIFRYGHAIAP
ncbi:FAD-binding oxidoreductase [Diaminobutyricimonas sp. LJ205]|uniref:FAD-binding oxidoreductase n=1 Tax=Diaminobutyricimonas sp. LJ205 TaxID=2683590 RepID=UPI0012F4E240|nr:FAD-binding oxidoreductase [Diaminobutyricimonas sp. LJ205]